MFVWTLLVVKNVVLWKLLRDCHAHEGNECAALAIIYGLRHLNEFYWDESGILSMLLKIAHRGVIM